jgi:hypothetical protein
MFAGNHHESGGNMLLNIGNPHSVQKLRFQISLASVKAPIIWALKILK